MMEAFQEFHQYIFYVLGFALWICSALTFNNVRKMLDRNITVLELMTEQFDYERKVAKVVLTRAKEKLEEDKEERVGKNEVHD